MLPVSSAPVEHDQSPIDPSAPKEAFLVDKYGNELWHTGTLKEKMHPVKVRVAPLLLLLLFILNEARVRQKENNDYSFFFLPSTNLVSVFFYSHE